MIATRPAMESVAAWQRRIHRSVLYAWTSLLLLVWTWNFSREISWERAAWALFYSMPLLLPLAGLLRRHRYTFAWATLCILPYLVVGITESVANADARPWAGAVLAAGLLLFVGLVAYLRVSRPIAADSTAGD